MSAQNQAANDPNKGMNVKTFLIAVIVAGCVIAIGLFAFVKFSGTKDIPKAVDPKAHPTSRLSLPADFALPTVPQMA
jgi:hypothetical protein